VLFKVLPIARVINIGDASRMSTEQRWNDADREQHKDSEKSPSQCE
jgi:hypothetical protein